MQANIEYLTPSWQAIAQLKQFDPPLEQIRVSPKFALVSEPV